jgi:hypothetical protein
MEINSTTVMITITTITTIASFHLPDNPAMGAAVEQLVQRSCASSRVQYR